MAAATETGKEEVFQKKSLADGLILDSPTGKILGSFGSFTLGLIWSVPNVRDTEMLTTIPVYSMLEEKVYFSMDLQNEPQFTDPTVVELFKYEGCNDVHIRAVNTGDTGIYTNEQLDMITPDEFVFSAAIVDGKGDILRREQHCRSYMAGSRGVGKRNWEIPSFIKASEFDMDKLLTPSGDLHLRLTFSGKKHAPNVEALGSPVGQPTTTTVPIANLAKDVSKSNANVKVSDQGGICEDAVPETILAHNYFAELALEGYPTRLNYLRKREKFVDASIIVTPPGGKGEGKRTFPVHRLVLGAQSPGFESAFESAKELTFDKYSVRSFEVLLNYMYTGELVCDRRLSILKELITIAEENEVIGLKDRCIGMVLEADKTIAGGIASFRLGIEHNSAPLKLGAMKIFEEHKDTLMECPDFQLFVRENNLEDLFFPMFVNN